MDQINFRDITYYRRVFELETIAFYDILNRAAKFARNHQFFLINTLQEIEINNGLESCSLEKVFMPIRVCKK